jgi:hypothetical protein
LWSCGGGRNHASQPTREGSGGQFQTEGLWQEAANPAEQKPQVFHTFMAKKQLMQIEKKSI